MDEMGQGMGEKRNACRVFVSVREGKKCLSDRHRLEDSIVLKLK